MDVCTSSRKADPVTHHCCCVNTGSMTLKELSQYISNLIEHVQVEILLRDSSYISDCTADINMPSVNSFKGQDSSKGYAFVWFTRKEVFYMVTGRDHKGNCTVASWEPVRPLDILKDSWDVCEIPMESYKMPLFVRPAAQPKVLADPAPRSDISDQEERLTVNFMTADMPRVSEEYEEGKLFCFTPLDSRYYTQDDVITIFAMFATAETKLSISYSPKGNIYVSFEHVDDAYFALCMRKKYKDPRTGVLLQFDYARKPPPPRHYKTANKSYPPRSNTKRRGKNQQY